MGDEIKNWYSLFAIRSSLFDWRIAIYDLMQAPLLFEKDCIFDELFGSKMADDKLHIIKQTVLKFFPDCRIVLFGSRAREPKSSCGDYDFLIIIRQDLDIKEKMHYKSLIRKVLAKEKIAADILIQSTSELEVNKNLSGHIVREAIKEGLTL
jgi:predicted nucleotidyltransferase